MQIPADIIIAWKKCARHSLSPQRQAMIKVEPDA
jgi:hypothetical protein